MPQERLSIVDFFLETEHCLLASKPKSPFFCYNFFERRDFIKTKLLFYFWVMYLPTALVPSEMACFASSPGNVKRAAVWISRALNVDFLL